MKLSDIPRLDPAVRKTIEAYLRDLDESDAHTWHQSSDSTGTLRFRDRVIVLGKTGLMDFDYELPKGGGCQVNGTLTRWPDVRVFKLTMTTNWKLSEPSPPQSWTLELSTPSLTLKPTDTRYDDYLAFIGVLLQRAGPESGPSIT